MKIPKWAKNGFSEPAFWPAICESKHGILPGKSGDGQGCCYSFEGKEYHTTNGVKFLNVDGPGTVIQARK